jgi:hypothetical protein
MNCSIENFLLKRPPLFQGAITFSPLVHFCQFLVPQMHQQKGSIYSLDTLNNRALLQKRQENLILNVRPAYPR